MAELPLFQFTTQEDWYWEIPFLNADANRVPLALVDENGNARVFEVPITPSQQGGAPTQPVATLTMGAGNGITFKDDTKTTLVFRVSKATALTFVRGEFTADILEVVSGERHLFMPVRVRYYEPSAILSFLSRMIGVTYSASRQPIVTPVAIAGRQGIRGPGIFSAARAPTGADGTDADFWINTSVSPRLFYGPKAAGVWPAGAPFISGVAEVPGLVAALAGKATPADIAAAIATLTAGSPAELNTFVEAYNRFLADESVATAINAALGVLRSDFTAHVADHTNPHAVNKAQVGLGNADNTSDANKPVSTAQAAADTAVQSAAATDATNKVGALSTSVTTALALKADKTDLGTLSGQQFSVADGNASAGQATFSVAAYTPGTVVVLYNGVQIPNSMFTATNGTSVTLADPIQATDFVVIRSLKAQGVQNAAPLVHQHQISDITGLQQLLALPSRQAWSAALGNFPLDAKTFPFPGGYTPGLLQVFRDGAIVASADYTATDGANIVFGSALPAGTVIDVIGQKGGGLVNAAPVGHTHVVDDVLNALDRRILSLAVDPGTADIPSGTFRVTKNTTTGRLSLWANDGGTMVDFLTLTTA